MNEDLKIIKKLYGEKMMHLCREYFPTILEVPLLLSNLMQEHFEPTHNLYDDLIKSQKTLSFKNFIYNLVDNEYIYQPTTKTPEELLSMAGYNLYECRTEAEIDSFRKYYAQGEQLCTFNGGRLDIARVFFAVKKDVDKIKREDFPHPLRQDLYGTSVISIQFSKDGNNTLSIKNRYNHRVPDPDATFSNDLENIIAGLTNSFEKYYGLKQSYTTKNFLIPGYTMFKNKYYKYNYEINGSYYCPDNLIIDDRNRLKRYPKEKYLVMDYFILDLVNKKITLLDKDLPDSFPSTFGTITKIDIKNTSSSKIVNITNTDGGLITIVLNKLNQIIAVQNNYVKTIENRYLYQNNFLEYIELSKVQEIQNYFLYSNNAIKELKIPNVKRIGNNFLTYNCTLNEVSFPNLETVSYNFLANNTKLKLLNAPKLQTFGPYFLAANSNAEIITNESLKR